MNAVGEDMQPAGRGKPSKRCHGGLHAGGAHLKLGLQPCNGGVRALLVLGDAAGALQSRLQLTGMPQHSRQAWQTRCAGWRTSSGHAHATDCRPWEHVLHVHISLYLLEGCTLVAERERTCAGWPPACGFAGGMLRPEKSRVLSSCARRHPSACTYCSCEAESTQVHSSAHRSACHLQGSCSFQAPSHGSHGFCLLCAVSERLLGLHC